jgi:6-phosphogluconolactonase
VTPAIRVFDSPEAVTLAARDEFVKRAAASIAAKKRFDVVLSGGRTPEGVYRALVPMNLEWKRIHVWFGDERCVPPVHQDSNFHMAAGALLSHVPIPAANVHRMQGELEAYRAAEMYEIEMKRALSLDDGEWPRFDLVLLGLGADGHTASLFPGTTALDDDQQLCCATWVEKLKAYRLTLTFPVFENAASVLFLACGADKGQAFQLATEASVNASTPPAGRIRPASGASTWFVDRALAAAAGR